MIRYTRAYLSSSPVVSRHRRVASSRLRLYPYSRLTTVHANVDGQEAHALGAVKPWDPCGRSPYSIGFPWATPGCPCDLPAADTQTRRQDGLTDMFASRGTWSAGTTRGAFTCLFLSVDLSHLPSPSFGFFFLLVYFPSPLLPSCPVQTAILYFFFPLFLNTSSPAPFPV